jgi:hypothetical protein
MRRAFFPLANSVAMTMAWQRGTIPINHGDDTQFGKIEK